MCVMHWENTLTSLLAAPSNRVFPHKENSPCDTNFPLRAECFAKVCGYQSSTEMEPQMCGAKLASGHTVRAGWPPCPCWEPLHGQIAILAPLVGPACNSPVPSKPTFCLTPKTSHSPLSSWNKFQTCPCISKSHTTTNSVIGVYQWP